MKYAAEYMNILNEGFFGTVSDTVKLSKIVLQIEKEILKTKLPAALADVEGRDEKISVAIPIFREYIEKCFDAIVNFEAKGKEKWTFLEGWIGKIRDDAAGLFGITKDDVAKFLGLRGSISTVMRFPSKSWMISTAAMRDELDRMPE